MLVFFLKSHKRFSHNFIYLRGSTRLTQLPTIASVIPSFFDQILSSKLAGGDHDGWVTAENRQANKRQKANPTNKD